MPSGRKPKFTKCIRKSCNEPHCAKGLCNNHYKQLRYRTDPDYRRKKVEEIRITRAFHVIDEWKFDNIDDYYKELPSKAVAS